MKTKNTEFKQVVSIWAIPKSSYLIEQNPDNDHFYFEVRTDSCWQSGAVNVHSEEISITVPAGIDITCKAVETLEKAKEEIMSRAREEAAEITNQINKLMLIEHDIVEEEWEQHPLNESGVL